MNARPTVAAVILIAIAALNAALSTPPVAAEEQALPVLAGVTTIEAEGITGITAMVPSVTGIRPGSAAIDCRDGTFAYVLVRSQDDEPVPGICEFCTQETFAIVPEMRAFDGGQLGAIGGCSNDAGTHVPCWLEPGPVEIYFVSDGIVTFTAEFVDLTGSTRLTAEGRVDGILERLDAVECPTGDCDRFSFGHAVHAAGTNGPGRVVSFAYAELPVDEIGPGIFRDQTGRQSIAGCTYPSFYAPDASPDPADHPTGCNFVPPPVGHRDGLRNLQTFFINGLGLNYSAQAVFSGTGEANGDVYAGFAQQNHTVGDVQGRSGAWAFWLDAGIH